MTIYFPSLPGLTFDHSTLFMYLGASESETNIVRRRSNLPLDSGSPRFQKVTRPSRPIGTMLLSIDSLMSWKKINNRCPGLQAPFETKSTKYFMDRNDSRGCVLPMIDGKLPEDVTHERIESGIYNNRPGQIHRVNWWTESRNERHLNEKQLEGIWDRAHRIPEDDENDTFFMSNWQITPNALATTVSLKTFAQYRVNPTLYWKGFSGMDPTHFPTIIWQDFIGVWKNFQDWDNLNAELKMFWPGLNLDLAIENCAINANQQPLLRGGASDKSTVFHSSAWNGTTVFANGTVVENPPLEQDPWRETVLRKGTKFANGTVVTSDIP